MSENYDIDFIIPWVDGNDPEWIASFNQYAPKEKQRDVDIGIQRYRDYGLLRYWFRSIEKFAPWVRKVHFVTCGQKPDWLNTNCTKLHCVKHEDYIPQDCLPVFSSHPIELYMHKIEDLSEHFVYFNDDLFLTAPVKKDFFFRNGKPCDSAILNAESTGNILGIIFENLRQINKNFNKKTSICTHFFKWFNPKYGSFLLRNFCLLPWPNFTGFYDPHMAQGFLKSNIFEVWEHCDKKLTETAHSKFRNDRDVNQWLFRYWHLCKGQFYPINPVKNRKYFLINNNIENICHAISKQKFKEIVINDTLEVNMTIEEFTERMDKIRLAFKEILPEKSLFEN